MGVGLFYAGIALMAGALLVGIAAVIVFHVWRSKLKSQLEQEYGPKEKKS